MPHHQDWSKKRIWLLSLQGALPSGQPLQESEIVGSNWVQTGTEKVEPNDPIWDKGTKPAPIRKRRWHTHIYMKITLKVRFYYKLLFHNSENFRLPLFFSILNREIENFTRVQNDPYFLFTKQSGDWLWSWMHCVENALNAIVGNPLIHFFGFR